MVISFIKKFIKRQMIRKGFYLSRYTSEEQLLNFFKLVRPVTTDFDLIRLGGFGDGGYLVPDDLKGIQVCFSPGVSNVADFELDLAKRGIKCFLADYSVERPPVENDLFDFEKKYLGLTEDDRTVKLENWINTKFQEKTSDMILQMDIEEGEFSVLFDTSRDLLKRFRILIIEFHLMDKIFDRNAFPFYQLIFEKLAQDFEIVHIHPNNCEDAVVYKNFGIHPVIEFTFLRKDRISQKSFTKTFPHPLDRKNLDYRPEAVLPACWYGR